MCPSRNKTGTFDRAVLDSKRVEHVDGILQSRCGLANGRRDVDHLDIERLRQLEVLAASRTETTAAVEGLTHRPTPSLHLLGHEVLVRDLERPCLRELECLPVGYREVDPLAMMGRLKGSSLLKVVTCPDRLLAVGRPQSGESSMFLWNVYLRLVGSTTSCWKTCSMASSADDATIGAGRLSWITFRWSTNI